MSEKITITQTGLEILKSFFKKRGVPDVIIRGPDGKPVVVEPGPTITTGKDIHTEKVGGGKISHKPDSDGNPT